MDDAQRTGSGVEPWTGIQVAVADRAAAYLWEWVGDRPLRMRVLRSRQGFAAHADEGWQGVGGQVAVFEGEGTSLRDAGLAPLTEYYYTFFARDGAGDWRELLRERLTTLATDEKPRGRPLLYDGPSPVDGAVVAAMGVVDLVLDVHSWLGP